MAAAEPHRLTPGRLTLADLHAFWRAQGPVELDPGCWPAVQAAAEAVAAVVREGRTVYGVTTGFGSLARTRISPDKVAELQVNLVRSHCAGTGEPLSPRVVRLVLLLKVGSLARGYSGVRPEVIERLLALLNADALPVVPAKGSVGASGDLAPLAHLAATLIGEGEIDLAGERRPAADAHAALGLEPLALGAKEGLALLNGSQVSTALALEGLFSALDVFAGALVAGAMSVDAALGSDVPFDPRIHAVRGQPGQAAVARTLARLIAESAIRHSHLDCDRVQDPYSLRCQPQVMGAALDQLAYTADVLVREANAVSDNPLVFADTGEILSGGNFHAEPVALAADAIAAALSEVAALSERRTALLTDANFSNLPAFLVGDPGLNSGFMLAQVTAAALAAEIKHRAQPAAVDSLPTSAGQEDHVSMATHAARRLTDMARDAADVVAIELLAAAQGIDLRAPLTTGPGLAPAHAAVRARAAFLDADRALAPDIASVAGLVKCGFFLEDVLRAEERPVLGDRD